MQRIELLAPAKDLECGMAAINCGADALYMGGARFGAREAAGNSLEDIRALAAYAHKYWARLYVTINTLLTDAELEPAARMIHELYEAGVDALIIQDAGLLELDLPPLPLFASTQMHNHTPERVAFLEKVGIQRAILARELSLEEIRAIRAHTRLELETFVHGALCVSYSGQCYMSYALGGRSGNRGQCAQPCRRPYRLLDAAGKEVAAASAAGPHLLSLRDLNLTEELPALLDAGVTSFKIEGRLKEKPYVMNVVGHYRQRLDALLDGRGMRPAASGRVVFDFAPNPAKTFNRGFTRYFIGGRREPVGSPETPKALGEPAGRVTRIRGGAFTLDGSLEIHRGDGLCFFNPARELVGSTVNDVRGGWVALDRMEGLAVGAAVYRSHDHLFLSALEKSETARKIRVRFRLAASMLGFALFAQDEDGCEAMFVMPGERILAEKPEQALSTIEKQLRKLGGTPFECDFVRIDLPEAYFLPLSTLNALRRGALEALERQRAEETPRPTGGALGSGALGSGALDSGALGNGASLRGAPSPSVPFPQASLGFEGNVLNRRAREFYQRHGVTHFEPAAESGLDLRGRRVMTTKHCIMHQLDLCRKYNPNARAIPAPEAPLSLVDAQGVVYPLRFRCRECEMDVYLDGPQSGL
jgi:putative protease